MSIDIRPITFDEIERLGLDAENQLYWDGKLIETKKRLSLTLWQKVGAIITVLSTLSLAVFDAIRFFQALSTSKTH